MTEIRTQVVRYPGVLTDWSGIRLDKNILNYITIGNQVRVAFKSIDGIGHNVVYFRIIKQCKKNRKWFVGVCDDPYYGEYQESLIKNGQERAFSIHHIMEIPLEWNGNQNLLKIARTYRRQRAVTGAIL